MRMYISAISGVSYNNQYQVYKPLRKNPQATQQISFKGDDEYFDYDKVLSQKLEQRSKWQKFWGTGKKKAVQKAISEMIGYNAARKNIDRINEQLSQSQREKIEQMKKTLQAQEKVNEELEKRLEAEKARNGDRATIIRLEEELRASKAKSEADRKAYETDSEKFRIKETEHEKVSRREKGKGWNKIAGYDRLKNQIEEVFINKIPEEKSGNDVVMPNGILLYGQHGTGKTRFAEAFAQQADCNFVKIDTMKDEDEIISDLKDALIQSRKNYDSKETPKKRTIILLDDFNSIAQISDDERDDMECGMKTFKETNVGKLAQLLENCADRYKATIFMTTNHPRKINSRLLNTNYIPYQIFLGPPSPADASKIFRYHTQDFTNQEIDYAKLGTMVARAIENEEAYSAQGIVNVVENAKKSNPQGQITQTDLEQAIKNTPPDISKKTFNDFLDDFANAHYQYAKNNNTEE